MVEVMAAVMEAAVRVEAATEVVVTAAARAAEEMAAAKVERR